MGDKQRGSVLGPGMEPAAWPGLCAYGPAPLSLLSSRCPMGLSPATSKSTDLLFSAIVVVGLLFACLFCFIFKAFPTQRRSPRAGCARGLSLRERGKGGTQDREARKRSGLGENWYRSYARRNRVKMKQEVSKLGKRKGFPGPERPREKPRV